MNLSSLAAPRAFARTRRALVPVGRVAGISMMLLCSLLLARPAVADGHGGRPELSLEAALSAAEARSQALRAEDLAATAALDRAVAAGRLPDPVLRLSLDNVPVEGPMRYSLSDDFMTMRSIGVSQTLTGADKREARRQRFERDADAAGRARELALLRLHEQTAQAWFDRHFAQQALALLQRRREEAHLEVVAAQAAFRAGKGSEADVFAARGALARIDDAMAESGGMLDVATHRLARWVGAEAQRPSAKAPDVRSTRFDPVEFESAALRHPEAALLVAREDAARAEADAARLERKADWSVSLMYSQRGRAYSDMVSVAVSVPLQWDSANRQDRVYSSKLAEAERMRAEREEGVREVQAEVRADFARWKAAVGRLAEYDATLLPLAQDRKRSALAAYRGGRSDLAPVLAARAAEIETELERNRLEALAARLWARLEFLLAVSRDPAAGEAAFKVLEGGR